MSEPFFQLYVAANAYAIAAIRDDDLDKQLAASWDCLRIANEDGRMLNESGSVNTDAYQLESYAIERFWPIRTRLSQKQCGELLAKLVDYDAHRDTWEDKHARQRIVDANADWETRMNLILANWSGREPPYWNGETYNPVIRLRLLITDLALRAYRMKYARLPEKIDLLVPEFLPAIPKDPFGSDSIVYRSASQTKDGYVLYSGGPDQDDDGGRWSSDSNWDGDFTTDLMFQ